MTPDTRIAEALEMSDEERLRLAWLMMADQHANRAENCERAGLSAIAQKHREVAARCKGKAEAALAARQRKEST